MYPHPAYEPLRPEERDRLLKWTAISAALSALLLIALFLTELVLISRFYIHQ